MELLNIAAIKAKMKNPPAGQKIYQFFSGNTSVLRKSQVAEIERIVESGNKKTMRFLSTAKAN